MKIIIISVVMIFISSCNTPSNSTKKDLKEITKEIMITVKSCAFITIDSLGVAHARAMDPFLPEDDFTVWFGTNSKSLKVQQIQKNKNVTLYYFDAKSGSYVTLQGVASIVNSPVEKEKYWKEEWKNFYENRTTDYLLIKFTPKKAMVISEKYSVLGDEITWKTPEINF